MKRILAFLLFMASPAMASFGNFQYRRILTINHTQVSTGTLTYTNFPALFQTTDVRLSTAPFGHLLNPNGYDLVFSSDPSCASKYFLHWDTDTINTNGTTQDNIWVQIPSISSTTDTIDYLCYGSTSTTSYMGYSTATWDSNYQGVYHLGISTTNALVYAIGSTSNTVAASVTGSTSTTFGKVGGSSVFVTSGTNNISFGNNTGLVQFGAVNLTFSMWYYPTLLSTLGNTLYSDSNGSTLTRWLLLDVSNIQIDLANASCSPINFVYSGAGNPVALNTWHFISITVSGTISAPTLTFALDGNSPQNFSPVALCNSPAPYGPLIGLNNTLRPFIGNIDEFRFSNTARSQDWVKNEYTTSSAPNSFMSIGLEQPAPISVQIDGNVRIKGSQQIL